MIATLTSGAKKHPHLRGEDREIEEEVCSLAETPPPAWGRRKLLIVSMCCSRNTPTCVGKTLFLVVVNRSLWKHPHLRGEDAEMRSSAQRITETPPPAWGRRKGLMMKHLSNRNTPTCVGKTRDHRTGQQGREKHPHLRGEDSRFRLSFLLPAETPPPAWGRHSLDRKDFASKRNTPTCVGKTLAHFYQFGQQWKHPHLRGEDAVLYRRKRGDLETPPPAWGRRRKTSQACFSVGNTPTCVGKTLFFRLAGVYRGKHPHLRGEDLTVCSNRILAVETPPPAWGRHLQPDTPA